jgi:hypothetical protein
MHAGSSVCVLTGMGIAHDSVMKAQSPPHPKPGRQELGPAAQSFRALNSLAGHPRHYGRP